MNKNELITIRNGAMSDKNFILATWLRGLYYGESWFSEIPKSIFMEHYHKVLDHILNNPDTLVRVSCLKEDPNVILGYAILSKSKSAAHWCFVKKAWRTIGIAKSLIPESTSVVTHVTKSGLSIIKKKNIVFNPFII